MSTIYGDRWEVIRPLSEGGQAHTFVVKDNKDGGKTQCVLKRLKNINRIDRFKREIEAVRNISHENIVQLVDFDIDTEKPYLVTEYCSGGSLSHAKPFWHNSPTKVFETFLQICSGIQYAHHNNIIHRDLKPDNIFLKTERGPAVIGDFGICFIEQDGTRITLTDEAVGPRLFIAPELEDGRLDDISTKSDIYSLGKVLYWLLSGGKIFSREKHRDPEYDLKRKKDTFPGWNNIYMEHANRLLDHMIVNKSEDRWNISEIIKEVKQVERLVRKEFTPIAKDIKQPCTYCGSGYYNNKQAYDLGLQAPHIPDWRVLVCSDCGHIQLFRVDMADQKGWWIK
ncbi:MAG: serine/threonine protein kinase [Planctomycetes bacterium]|nr:serine/threonine protein kinase [Planctomycetota bacterium]